MTSEISRRKKERRKKPTTVVKCKPFGIAMLCGLIRKILPIKVNCKLVDFVIKLPEISKDAQFVASGNQPKRIVGVGLLQ